ncbi:MAG TPA: RNA polymerase sigma factor [Puia sp.]|nr:RNA polymerase sigma factor [Puia sp.]
MVNTLALIDLGKFRDGDEAVLKDLMGIIEEPLYSYSKRQLRDPNDANDIVAETIVALWNYRLKIKDHLHIVNYVYKVARRKIKHFIKKYPDRLTPSYYRSPSLITDPHLSRVEDELAKAWWARRAQQIIDSSPHEYAEVFRLHQQGKSNKEIAAELGKSPHTVRNQIGSMRNKVAQMLLEEGFPRDLLMVFFLYFLS